MGLSIFGKLIFTGDIILEAGTFWLCGHSGKDQSSRTRIMLFGYLNGGGGATTGFDLENRGPGL